MRSPAAENINILWSDISMGCNYKIVASTLNNSICIIEKKFRIETTCEFVAFRENIFWLCYNFLARPLELTWPIVWMNLHNIFPYWKMCLNLSTGPVLLLFCVASSLEENIWLECFTSTPKGELGKRAGSSESQLLLSGPFLSPLGAACMWQLEGLLKTFIFLSPLSSWWAGVL